MIGQDVAYGGEKTPMQVIDELRAALATANEELERRRRLDAVETDAITRGRALMEEAHKRLADEVEKR